jgi:hypothetical protein
MNPTDFEQQIARILRALHDKDVDVVWNDKFPDPDNPSQLRQVDISIRGQQRLTIVECRLHRRKQDVKWIEELHGRKISLNAEAIIGVSSSGFTTGAIEKARRLGVFLRSLSALTDEEIATWGSRTKTSISYVKFSKIRLCIIADDKEKIPFPSAIHMLRSGDAKVHPIQHALNSCVNRLCEMGAPEGPFSMQIFFERTLLGTMPVTEAVLQSSWRWVHCEVLLPTVLVYEDTVKTGTPAVRVEKNSYSRTEVHHRSNGAFAIIDVSTAVPERCCFLREVKIVPGQDVAITAVGLLGIDQSAPGFCDVELVFANRSSPDYLAFLHQASPE